MTENHPLYIREVIVSRKKKIATIFETPNRIKSKENQRAHDLAVIRLWYPYIFNPYMSTPPGGEIS